MTFEEDHPGLKGKELHEYYEGAINPPAILYDQDDVAASCLDRAKVKEAIETAFLTAKAVQNYPVQESVGTAMQIAEEFCNQLLKELGLE